ncbi:hypothetical protein D5S17_18555 [Pseudonocardiaceae bacterium YIM PH 21723]|nr:hypothetical protein D5S17_18555 [Pseudonocardiaceae bacterium YIM PH 21723]
MKQALKTLPQAALRSYAEALTVLELTLWDAGQPFNRAVPDGMRQLDFHSGMGTILYQVIEHVVEVHVVRLVHVG